MNELQIFQPVLNFIFYEWQNEVMGDIIAYYEYFCSDGDQKKGHLILFENMADYMLDWLYKVRSQEEFGDRDYYQNFVLSDDEDGGDSFYDECHWSYEPEFRDDLFTIMRDMGLSFYTHDGGYHNMPFKGVW